jgi:hypothetical protein
MGGRSETCRKSLTTSECFVEALVPKLRNPDPRNLRPAAPTFSPAAPVPEPFDGEPYRLPAPVAGVVLSPLHAMLLTFAALTILALAFAVGLLVGRYLL